MEQIDNLDQHKMLTGWCISPSRQFYYWALYKDVGIGDLHSHLSERTDIELNGNDELMPVMIKPVNKDGLVLVLQYGKRRSLPALEEKLAKKDFTKYKGW